MKELRSNSILWVIATLAVATVPQFPRMTFPVAVMTLVPLLWKLGAELNGWKPLANLARYAITALSIGALVVSYGDLFGRRASVSLLAAMLTLKLLECERIRDARLIVSFSFFLCATQFLFAQGVLMFGYGLATIVLGLVALAQLQRNEAFELADEIPSLKMSMYSDLAFSLRLLALAAPVAIAFFLFFPRWASPLWGVPESTLDAKSGLSDSMSPGSIQSLFMDDSPAFRVTFDSPFPGPSDLYWRGPVFWQYQDNTWSSNFFSRNLPPEILPDETRARWRYTVQLEPNERNWLFALNYPVMAPPDTRISIDFQLRRLQPVLQLFQYRMASNPEFVDTPVLKETLRKLLLEVPEDLNPETRELMTLWRAETADDRKLIQRVLEYFREQKFYYSLDAPLLGRDAVDDFLFNTRTGFCEHYASAFAVMMRMAGIPSRVVTGYLGGWYSEFGDYLLVRQSDAHAWTEVWLESEGWTRVDPTAAVSPQRILEGAREALNSPRHFLDFKWVRSLRNGFDLMEQRWNEWVIEFGARNQARLFSAFGLDYLSPTDLVAVLFGLLGLISPFLMPLVFRTFVHGNRDPVRQAWQKFLRLLKKEGFLPRVSDGAMELASAASSHIPERAKEIYHVAGLYNRYRYSPEPPDAAKIQTAVKNFRHGKRSDEVR